MTSYLKPDKFLAVLFLCILLSACSGGRYILKDIDWQPYSLPPTQVSRHLYSCQINGSAGIRKYSFSGLLFIKQMEDDSKRVVFQNEAGFTFFDFEWQQDGTFQVIQIQERMNREALIKTLKKDFEVLFQINHKGALRNVSQSAVQTQLEKGVALYEVQSGNKKHIYILDDSYKKIVSFISQEPIPITGLQQELHIRHHKAGFEIKLKALSQDSA